MTLVYLFDTVAFHSLAEIFYSLTARATELIWRVRSSPQAIAGVYRVLDNSAEESFVLRTGFRHEVQEVRVDIDLYLAAQGSQNSSTVSTYSTFVRDHWAKLSRTSAH